MKICSKCRKIKDFDEFYSDEREKDGLRDRCKKCYNEDIMNRRNYRRQRIKPIFDKIARKIGCVSCGTHEGILDWHHINGRAKYGDKVSSMILSNLIDAIKQEMEKCDILCRSCHSRVHQHLRGKIVHPPKGFWKYIVKTYGLRIKRI